MTVGDRDLSGHVRRFLIGYWDTDVREQGSSDVARTELDRFGIRDAVRVLIRDAMAGRGPSPTEWARLFNVWTPTTDDVRDDAADFWRWLFHEEPPESE